MQRVGRFDRHIARHCSCGTRHDGPRNGRLVSLPGFDDPGPDGLIIARGRGRSQTDSRGATRVGVAPVGTVARGHGPSAQEIAGHRCGLCACNPQHDEKSHQAFHWTDSCLSNTDATILWRRLVKNSRLETAIAARDREFSGAPRKIPTVDGGTDLVLRCRGIARRNARRPPAVGCASSFMTN